MKPGKSPSEGPPSPPERGRGRGKDDLRYIRGFDGLRALAVALVLAAHSGTWEGLRGQPWFDQFVYPLVLGENGVLIFFALSGFLITHLLLRERERIGHIHYGYFLARRALRLLPAFTIFWLILLAFTLLGYYDIHPASFAFAAAYLYNFIPKHFYSGYFGLTWSLGVEEQFYLLWPLLLRRLPAVSLRAGVGWATGLFVVASLLFMAFVPDLHLPPVPVSANGEALDLSDYNVGRVFFPYRWFIPMGSYLLLGCLAAAWIDRLRGWLASGPWPLLLVTLLFLAPWYAGWLGYFPQKLLQTAGFALFIGWLFVRQQSIAAQLLEWAPLRHLGRLSYGLYLYSGIFLATGISKPTYWWQEVPVALVLTYGLALVSFGTVEGWFLQRKKDYRTGENTYKSGFTDREDL